MSFPLKHSKECQAYSDQITSERAAWIKRFPNYCRSCGGMGGFHDPGVYRYADGSGQPPTFDECANCIDAGCCPRCGMDWLVPIYAKDWSDAKNIDDQFIAVYRYDDNDTMPLMLWADILDGTYPCPCCGWNWGQNQDDIVPPDLSDLGPCPCELEYEEQLSREYWRQMERDARERGDI